MNAARSHWSIENSVHRVLDVAFREDDSRIRQSHAQHNPAILRRVALSLLHTEKSAKIGIAAKRKRAGCNHDYLLKVLFLQDAYALTPPYMCLTLRMIAAMPIRTNSGFDTSFSQMVLIPLASSTTGTRRERRRRDKHMDTMSTRDRDHK